MRSHETLTDLDLEAVAGGWCATPVPQPPCFPPRPLPGFPPRPPICPMPGRPHPWDPPAPRTPAIPGVSPFADETAEG